MAHFFWLHDQKERTRRFLRKSIEGMYREQLGTISNFETEFLSYISQEFSEEYHAKKSLDATVSDNVAGSIIGGRTLMRSNSIQDELLTTF